MAYYDISEVFQKIEEDMIASMMRNLKRHLATEKEEGINYAMWQAEQLAALNEFKRNNKSFFKSYFSTINGQIEEVLRKAHETGKMDQEVQILEAIQRGWSTALKNSGSVQGAFFRINDRKLKALINSVTNDMKKAETAMLRRVDDEYRKILFNSQAYYNTGAGTLPQCVDMATKDFLSKGIDCIEYKNGARVGIDSYARMAIRTATTRAYLLGESEKRDEWGISTVIVNKRGVACPRCLKYVGRVFYDDVWGSAPIPSPEKYPRLSEAIAGGLYHPNCKDVHTTYFEGVTTPPKPMTDAQKKEAERVYNLEQQQRYNERQIRKYKRLSDGSVDPENQLRYQKKLEAWQDTQRNFVKANGDVLKRRYENEKLFVSEFTEPPNASANPTSSVKKKSFIPAKTREEAESFISQYVDSSQWGATGISYSGISVETANIVNETLANLYDTFNLEKLGGVFVAKGNTKLGQAVEGAVAGYSPIRKSLILNNRAMKNVDDVVKSHAEEIRLVKMYAEDPTSLTFKTKRAEAVTKASIKSGRATVPDNVSEVIHHEVGHSIEGTIRKSEKYSTIKANMPRYAENISGYATLNESEYIAESFVSYLKGEGVIDPELRSVFDSLRKGVKTSAKTIEKIGKSDIISSEVKRLAKYSSKSLKTIILPKQEYAHVMSELATNMSKAQRQQPIVKKAIGDYIYTVENNGFGDYRIIGKKPIDGEKVSEIKRLGGKK